MNAQSGRDGFGDSRILDAQRLLERASKSGDYKTFERALAAFDAVIATGRNVAEAEKGKRETHFSYATHALINRDLELAMSLVEPLQGTGREAEALKNRIHDKMVANRLRHRNMRLLWPVVGVILSLVVVAWVNFYRYLRKAQADNPTLTNLAERVDRALGVAAAQKIHHEFTTLYGMLQTERQDFYRKRYSSFDECQDVLHEASNLMISSRVTSRDHGDGPMRKHLFENLPLLNRFRHELATEKDSFIRRNNVRLLQSLDKLIQLLIEHVDEKGESDTDEGGPVAEDFETDTPPET